MLLAHSTTIGSDLFLGMMMMVCHDGLETIVFREVGEFLELQFPFEGLPDPGPRFLVALPQLDTKMPMSTVIPLLTHETLVYNVSSP